LLEQVDDDAYPRLAGTDPDFAAAVDAYLHDYGCRVFHHAIHYPTLMEKPAILLRLVRDRMARGFDSQIIAKKLEEDRAAAMAEAHAAFAKRSAEDRERFEKALESAQQVYPIKEDCEYSTFDVPTALMRYALLELGNRLIRQGWLDSRSDVFFMELEELLAIFREGKDARDLVAHRKAERAWIEAHPGPPSYGVEPQIPFNAYPPEIQLLVKGMLWVRNEYYGFVQPQIGATETVLRGSAASPGRYTGPARVIRNESEFAKLQAGDVLICPITTPSWSVLFPTIGAIVTDAGGILSHPAIIAREYRVPAVVATKNATSLLKDGQTVTVDGSAGTVEIES